MELLKDKETLKMIKEEKIDSIFFEKIDEICIGEEKLSFIGENYSSSLDKFNKLDREVLDKLEEVFARDFESTEDLKIYIGEVANLLDYKGYEPSTEELDKIGMVTTLYDDMKQPYTLTCTYTDRTRDGSSTEVYNMSYSLKDSEEKSPAVLTEANMYFGSGCKCCERKEVNVIFPEGEDIGHYIIVSELNRILLRINDIIEEYKSKYNKYMSII